MKDRVVGSLGSCHIIATAISEGGGAVKRKRGPRHTKQRIEMVTGRDETQARKGKQEHEALQISS